MMVKIRPSIDRNVFNGLKGATVKKKIASIILKRILLDMKSGKGKGSFDFSGIGVDWYETGALKKSGKAYQDGTITFSVHYASEKNDKHPFDGLHNSSINDVVREIAEYIALEINKRGK